ncbi:MAG: glycosyltransferase [Candidatus Edwardsbacteria bacterium]
MKESIFFLTAIESPTHSVGIEYQFLNPLKRLAQIHREMSFSYLALIPWRIYFFPLHPLRGKKKDLQNKLASVGVRCHLFPIPYPIRYRDFHLKLIHLSLFVISALPGLFYYVLKYKIDLIHVRSYPACLLAFFVKRLLKIPYIFDLRGMYPEEGINSGVFTLNSFSYRLWKAIEGRLLKESSISIAVSEPFAEYVRELIPQAGVCVVPCCVDTRIFHFEPEKKKEVRHKFGLEEYFVLLHSGSFGTPGDRGLAAQYFLRFKKMKENAHLVILSGTPAFRKKIETAIEKEGVKKDEYTLINPSAEEIPSLLLLGDAGLILERKMPNTKVCLSIKLGEYLSCGLPVICTPYVEGAARLVEKYNCGLIIDPDKETTYEKEQRFLEDYQQLRENGFKLVKEYLSLEKCVEKWCKIYEEVNSQCFRKF